MRIHKTGFATRRNARFLTGLAMLAAAVTALGFPPAPYHTIYGMVKDEMGQPLMSSSAVVTLTATNGVQIATPIVPNLSPGMNYRLLVPMDTGTFSYKPTAIQPLLSFRMKVVDGGVTYLPMEVKANFANLGQPAQSTRMDLTLGVDSDGDGLPDAWEQLLIDMGFGQTLADIRPGDDSDGDGISNLNEYLAGTYAFDPTDGFSLNIAGIDNGWPLLDFMALPGRSYTVKGSADMKTWSVLNFRIVANGPSAPLQSYYASPDVRMLRVAAEVPSGKNMMFFKAMVQ